jgi:hypothetical protein
MGGIDTRGRYHVHWGPPETYGERREESALRRSGRTVPDRRFERFDPIDTSAVDAILEEHDNDPGNMLQILGAVQEAYGYLPVAALKRISFRTGAWYAMIYGTASYYRHLTFEPPANARSAETTPASSKHAALEASYVAGLAGAVGGDRAAGTGRAN